MKILLLNNGFPSKQNPNYTTYIKSIQDCLEIVGFEVDKLVISYDNKITKYAKIVKYIRFWIICIYINLKKYDYIYINHLPYCWPIIYNPSLKRNNVIVHWHGNELVGKSSFLNLIHKIIKKRVSTFQHIVPSKYFRFQLIQKFNINPNKINVSPSGGVDTKLFYPRRKETKENEFTIGYAGGLISSKGADVLDYLIENTVEIEKLSKKEISFRIINYGEDAEKYITKFKTYDSNIIIDEKMTKSKMPYFYNSIDLLIFPSTRIGESLGLVALEALSCGVPVVAFNLCAFPEFIVPGISGELVEYESDTDKLLKSFLSTVCHVINNYDKYSTRPIVEANYSMKSVIKSYKSLLE